MQNRGQQLQRTDEETNARTENKKCTKSGVLQYFSSCVCVQLIRQYSGTRLMSRQYLSYLDGKRGIVNISLRCAELSVGGEGAGYVRGIVPAGCVGEG